MRCNKPNIFRLGVRQFPRKAVSRSEAITVIAAIILIAIANRYYKDSITARAFNVFIPPMIG